MAAKRPTRRAVKKTGKKAPLRKGGHRKQAKKPVGRKKPLGAGRKTSNKMPRARRLGKQAGATSQEPVEVLETSKTTKKRRS
jgi:hypothetical protein